MLLLKLYLQSKGLKDVYTGGLGSFSLTIMLVFYLEVRFYDGVFKDGSICDLFVEDRVQLVFVVANLILFGDVWGCLGMFGVLSMLMTTECIAMN